jgi:hypothetical protein
MIRKITLILFILITRDIILKYLTSNENLLIIQDYCLHRTLFTLRIYGHFFKN